MTIPLDIDETTFVAHPMITAGTKLKDMKGTSDYDMALGMITSFRETVAPDDCDEVGNAGLASYEWSSINDATAPVSISQFLHQHRIIWHVYLMKASIFFPWKNK